MLQLGGMLNKLMQFDCIIYGGLQAKPQLLGNFRNFFKKITILPSFGLHFERF